MLHLNSLNGLNSFSDLDVVEENVTPENFVLNQNYPNPFNPSTKISYFLPKNSQVSLKIYNLKGQRVKTLVNEVQQSGNHAFTWNGINSKGKKVSSGIYFYSLNVNNSIQTKKMLLLK